LKQPVSDYFKLFYADTSGQAPTAIKSALDFFGAEHVMLGSDAPFGTLPGHFATLMQLPMSAGDRALLLGGNAERVLGLARIAG
jgi:predicted TIM-barrel fold metal-dependent hydrolase